MQLKKIDFVSSNTFWSYEVVVLILEILIFCMDFRAIKIYILLCQHFFFLKGFSLDSWTCTNPFLFYKRQNEKKKKKREKQFQSDFILPHWPSLKSRGTFNNFLSGFEPDQYIFQVSLQHKWVKKFIWNFLTEKWIFCNAITFQGI